MCNGNLFYIFFYVKGLVLTLFLEIKNPFPCLILFIISSCSVYLTVTIPTHHIYINLYYYTVCISFICVLLYISLNHVLIIFLEIIIIIINSVNNIRVRQCYIMCNNGCFFFFWKFKLFPFILSFYPFFLLYY